MQGILLHDYVPVVQVKRDAYGKIVGGMMVGDILAQNQALLLTLHPGELKDAPAIGVGLTGMLLDHNPLMWRGLIREQLEMDGQTVERIRIKRESIEIVAKYEE